MNNQQILNALQQIIIQSKINEEIEKNCKRTIHFLKSYTTLNIIINQNEMEGWEGYFGLLSVVGCY